MGKRKQATATEKPPKKRVKRDCGRLDIDDSQDPSAKLKPIFTVYGQLILTGMIHRAANSHTSLMASAKFKISLLPGINPHRLIVSIFRMDKHRSLSITQESAISLVPCKIKTYSDHHLLSYNLHKLQDKHFFNMRRDSNNYNLVSTLFSPDMSKIVYQVTYHLTLTSNQDWKNRAKEYLTDEDQDLESKNINSASSSMQRSNHALGMFAALPVEETGQNDHSSMPHTPS